MYFPVSALLIEFMILSIVNREDSYGYEISQTIKLVADIKESTLYPILKKLEKAGYVTTYSAEYQGRKRKYYSITEAGKTQMAYLQGEWKSYRDTIDDIIVWRKKNDEWGISETIGKVSEEASRRATMKMRWNTSPSILQMPVRKMSRP